MTLSVVDILPKSPAAHLLLLALLCLIEIDYTGSIY